MFVTAVFLFFFSFCYFSLLVWAVQSRSERRLQNSRLPFLGSIQEDFREGDSPGLLGSRCMWTTEGGPLWGGRGGGPGGTSSRKLLNLSPAFRGSQPTQRTMAKITSPISYSRYWTGTSLRWRLIWKANRISLSFKLVPVQYREYKYGLKCSILLKLC